MMFLGVCKFGTEVPLNNDVSTHAETQSYWVSVPKGWGFELLMSGTHQGINEASKTKAIQICKRLDIICQQAKHVYSDAIEPESADCRDNRAEIIFVKSEESDYPNQPIYIAKLDHKYNVVGVEKSW